MDGEPRGSRRAAWSIAAIALALGAGSIVYRLAHWGEVGSTAVLFVGIPTAIAIVLAFTSPARSLTGTTIKTLAIGLSLSGIVLAEGFVCIVMAAPLFFLVGAAVAKGIDAVRGRRHRPQALSLVVLPFVLLSFEGAISATSLPREGSVTAERVVDATAEQVRDKLASPPAYYAEVPALFRLGFPTPVSGEGSGLDVGDRRRVIFTMGEFRLVVKSTAARSVTFARVADTTPVTDWVEIGDSHVTWDEISPGRTRIRWTMTYVRKLDPAWYFGPLERFGVGQAAGYLIDTVATP